MMDLSNFKILKEDADNFHIEAPSGHKMSVHKALLSGPAKSMIKKMCSGGEVQKFDDGGDVVPASLSINAPDAVIPDPAAIPESVAQSVPAAIAAPAEPVSTGPVQEVAPADPIMQKGMSMDQLLSKEQNDVADLSKAQIGEAGAQSKAYKEYNDKMAEMQSPQEVMDSYKAKDEQLMKSYLDQKIDPDNYIHHMSTGSKIKAGIAMALGGLGAGLTGGPNQAMEWFKGAIDRDMEAQKNDQGKNYNLWRMNRDAMGDNMRANMATKNQMWTGVQAKIAMAAANAQAPVAKFHAQQMIDDIEKQKISNRQTMGLMTQGMQGGGSFSTADPAQLVQQMVPKELQPKAYEEIGAAQETVKNAPGILKAFDNAANNIHAVDIIPGMQNVDQKAMHTLLGPTFKDVEGTVRQAAMDNLFGNVTPQVGDNANTINVKRGALMGYLKSKSSAPINKGNGVDLSRFSSTSMDPMARLNSSDQRAVNWAKANPSNPNSAKILKANGIE